MYLTTLLVVSGFAVGGRLAQIAQPCTRFVSLGAEVLPPASFRPRPATAPSTSRLTRFDSSVLPRLATPYKSSPRVIAVVNCASGGTVATRRISSSGGSLRTTALSVSVSKQ